MRCSLSAILALVVSTISSPLQEVDVDVDFRLEARHLKARTNDAAAQAFAVEAKAHTEAAAQAAAALTTNMHQEVLSRLQAAHQAASTDDCTGLLCSLGISSTDISTLINATAGSTAATTPTKPDFAPFFGYPGYPYYNGYYPGGYYPNGYCPAYGYGGYGGYGYGGYPYSGYGCGGGGGGGATGFCPVYNPYYGGYQVPAGYPKPGEGKTDCKDVQYQGYICNDAYNELTICYGDAKGDYLSTRKVKCSYFGTCAASDDGSKGYCIC